MISVSGKRCRVSRIRSMPWPSGNCRSVSSTFGALAPEAGAGLGQGARRRDLKAGTRQRVLQPPQGRRIVFDKQYRNCLRRTLYRSTQSSNGASCRCPRRPVHFSAGNGYATAIFMGVGRRGTPSIAGSRWSDRGKSSGRNIGPCPTFSRERETCHAQLNGLFCRRRNRDRGDRRGSRRRIPVLQYRQPASGKTRQQRSHAAGAADVARNRSRPPTRDRRSRCLTSPRRRFRRPSPTRRRSHSRRPSNHNRSKQRSLSRSKPSRNSNKPSRNSSKPRSNHSRSKLRRHRRSRNSRRRNRRRRSPPRPRHPRLRPLPPRSPLPPPKARGARKSQPEESLARARDADVRRDGRRD